MRPALLACLLALPLPAAADGEAAWDAFRASVEAACRAALGSVEDAEVEVEVNPFGSESYGVALLTVAADWGSDRYACVMDKATGRAELTAAFAAPAG